MASLYAVCESSLTAYIDLKNAVVFQKVFGKHPFILAGVLNDLRGREGDRAIVKANTTRRLWETKKLKWSARIEGLL
jgi:hypothetical protein